MIVYPNAKINIGLNIESTRLDGFHNISTLFYPVKSIYDILEVIETPNQSSRFEFSQSGLSVDCDTQHNLCVRAFNLMDSRCNLPPIAAHLHKQIPMGAGLGGGSSDATFMLVVLNEMIGSPISAEELASMALQLGSDCPFFLRNTPCIGRGRGELLTDFNLNLCSYGVLLVNPGIHVSTAEAYANSSPMPWKVDIENLLKGNILDWERWVFNDFERGVFAKYPQIADIKAQMYNLGAIYASMSGSGSTVYGIFGGDEPDTRCFDNYFCEWALL